MRYAATYCMRGKGLILAAIGMAALVLYGAYQSFFVYTDGKPTRHDVRIMAEAEDGYAHSQYLTGLFHLSGRQGMPADAVAARGWFEKASAQGYLAADFRLAELYRHGTGVTADLPRALELYRRAARGGNPEAQNALAELYRDGTGVERDVEQAVAWLRRAADADYPAALRNLGGMAYVGIGMERDLDAARQWYNAAAAEGDEAALTALGGLYERGEGVPADPVRARSCYFTALLGHYEPARAPFRAVGATLSVEQRELAESTPCADYDPPQ